MIRRYYLIVILNSADILLTQKLGARLFSGLPAFLGHSNSAPRIIFQIHLFLFGAFKSLNYIYYFVFRLA